MEDFEEPATCPSAPRSPRWGERLKSRRQGIALALMLTLGAVALLGTALATNAAQAAPAASTAPGAMPGGAEHRLTPTVSPGTPGACDGDLTVSKVTSRFITVTRPDGSTATIHIGSKTNYTQNGHTVSVSAVKVGSKIYVVGSCTNGGRSINATSIQIVG